MRSASGALTTLLNSGRQFYVADLLTITQANGTITRLTAATVPVVANGFTFLPTFAWTRDGMKLTTGLEVARMNVTLYPNPTVDTLGGVSWQAAVQSGALDEARISLDRAFMANWGDTSAGTINVFTGRVGLANPSRTVIRLEILADVELFRATMPRNSYQPGCLHTLYDSGCTLLKATFAVTGSVGAGSTVSQLNTTLANATGYFDLGTITFTSGALSGKSFSVKSFISATKFIPLNNFPVAPGTGDTFTAYPGCDKAQSTCSSKFANLAHFRGFPYIPSPENAR